jgi:hypothetical protein
LDHRQVIVRRLTRKTRLREAFCKASPDARDRASSWITRPRIATPGDISPARVCGILYEIVVEIDLRVQLSETPSVAKPADLHGDRFWVSQPARSVRATAVAATAGFPRGGAAVAGNRAPRTTRAQAARVLQASEGATLRLVESDGLGDRRGRRRFWLTHRHRPWLGRRWPNSHGVVVVRVRSGGTIKVRGSGTLHNACGHHYESFGGSLATAGGRGGTRAPTAVPASMAS